MLTSQRARATIAPTFSTPASRYPLNDLQQWIGHKHPAGTRYYAAILQRTLTASHEKADYFDRNFRTIQVLIDRECILTGATHQAANSPGSTTGLGERATAITTSSPSVRTGWSAHAARSTSRPRENSERRTASSLCPAS
ncbi:MULTISPECIES: hypothetical protein [unclassified Streptomyces]|uniref:hypothetical protein n=1 Tax=unclassified Streptomyces TaxID=2593676 RepID=UPI00131B0DAD|nr:hypothetical protein [Streptomyces sp. CB01635]